MAQDDRRQRGLTLEELCTAPVFCWEQRTGRCFCGSAEFQILPGGSVKWVEFALPWYNSSGCVRIAPGTGHTWLSPRGASPFSWMGRRCCRGVAPAQAALPQRHRFGRLEGPIFDCTVAIRVSLMLFLQAVKSWGCFSVIQFGRGSF